MKVVGVWLAVLGIVITIGALLLATSLPADVPPAYLPGGASNQVYNVGLLQRQMMVFNTGLAIALAGVVVASIGALMDREPRPFDRSASAEDTVAATVATPPYQAAAPQLSAEEQAIDNASANRVMYAVLGGLVLLVGVVLAIVWLAN